MEAVAAARQQVDIVQDKLYFLQPYAKPLQTILRDGDIRVPGLNTLRTCRGLPAPAGAPTIFEQQTGG